jgi:pimeloyl-ACP methyl ester carboxylesterase
MWGIPLLLAAALTQPRFEPQPCAGDVATDRSVTCGTVRAPEDRRNPGGRTIDLNVMVLGALSPKPDLPALFDIDGGPGLASTRSSGFYRTDGLAYRKRRAVVLFDQRGTGASHALDCPELVSLEAALRPLYPQAAVARCRKALSAHADPAQYDTTAAAADFDAIRAALGFEQVDIVAISYGTTLSLRYMADFPGRVRAAVLSGVVPAAEMPPRNHAVVAEGALTQNFADCAAEPNCLSAYPDLAGDLRKAVAWLDNHQEAVAAQVFLEKLRTLLYSPATARSVPLVVHAASSGDLTPFARLAGSGAPSGYAEGLYLSITCAESIAAMDFAAAAAASRRTRFGDYRLARQRDACQEWPHAKVSKSFFTPVRSDAQVLLISGGRDPVTPSAWADKAARTLPNARRILIPWSGHTFDGLSNIDTCFDPMLLAFFDRGAAATVDAGCTAGMLPPPFVLPMR